LPEVFGFSTVTTVSVPAGGGFAEDAQGVGASIGEGGLDPGGSAALTSENIDPALADQISAEYEIGSLAYAVAAAGDTDGRGQAALRFPASSSEARLAVVVDGAYLGLLELEPEGGYLTIETHVGAQSGMTVWAPDVGEPQPRRYMVVLPRNPAGLAPREGKTALAPTGGGGGAVYSLAPPQRRQAPALRRCDLIGVTICMTDGSVYFYHKNPLADNAVLAEAASVVHAILDQYAALGVKASRISPSNPIHIVIGNYGNPTYSALTGNLYLDWANIQNLQGAEAVFQANLSHEIAHWLQDCTYVMTSATFSQLSRWWLEVSAENLSFIQNPAALGSNLASYGRLQEEGDVRYGMQLAPFVWPGSTDARYFQAIPVHVGMCDDPALCLFSRDQFVEAINQGVNPFAEGGRTSTYYLLLEDTARYLLGFAPTYANSAISIPPALRTGNLANEWIAVREGSGGTAFDKQVDSQAPQVSESGDEVLVQASVERGGLYSFRFGNTGRAIGVEAPPRPGLPAFLEIQGGAPFLFTIDNGEPKAEDGTRTLYIAPVHDTMGLKLVRAAAYAEDGPKTFQAKAGYVDLTGDWITENFTITNSAGYCGDESTSGSPMDMAEDMILKFLAGYGHFEPAGTPTDSIPYKWVQDEAFPEGEGSFTLTASAQVTTQDVQVEYTLVVPPPAEGTGWLPWSSGRRVERASPLAGVLATLSFAVFGSVALRRHPRRAKVLVLLAALVLAPQLAACDFDLDFWGTISGQYSFRKLAYLPEDFAPILDQRELWRLTEGEGTMVLDLTVKMKVDEGTEEAACLVTNSVKTDLLILAKGAISPAEAMSGD
jgi:hypothetical protein